MAVSNKNLSNLLASRPPRSAPGRKGSKGKSAGGKGTSINLQTMTQEHYRDLYEIHCRADISPCASLEEFSAVMDKQSGFVVVDTDRIIGGITFSGWVPEHDINIHFTIDPEYEGEWLTERVCVRILDYCFGELNLQRIGGHCLLGISDKEEKLLLTLGFKEEGILRRKWKHRDGSTSDIKAFGMLREERRDHHESICGNM